MLDPVYQTSQAKRRFLEKLARTMPGNAGFTQCQRLLEALRKHPISTAEARRFMDVYDPASRIRDLRHKHGVEVDTHWWRGVTEQGVSHRIGRYVLIAEAGPLKPSRKAKKGGAK
jgi:hypothetical protein